MLSPQVVSDEKFSKDLVEFWMAYNLTCNESQLERKPNKPYARFLFSTFTRDSKWPVLFRLRVVFKPQSR